MLGEHCFLKDCMDFLAVRAGLIDLDAENEAKAAEERLTALLADGVRDLGAAVDGGPLDYAGRIYRVGGQECLVRLFDYTDEDGTVHAVVRPDGYQRILSREESDNHIAHMSLKSDVDRMIKTALKTYIARSYTEDRDSEVLLILG